MCGHASVDRRPGLADRLPATRLRARAHPVEGVWSLLLALVHGSGYERISTPGCSDRTIRRRLKEWSRQGISKALHALALDAYGRMFVLHLGEISVDGGMGQAGAEALRRLR